jgi:hypothetical protein
VKYLVVEAAVLIEVKCSNKNNYFHRPIKLSDENLAILVKFHPVLNLQQESWSNPYSDRC